MKINKRLSQIQKIGYGVGDAGSNLCWTFIASFIMIYCTNTLKISAAVIGSLMMFSKLFDGITDVIMGRIIDATHSKMGKARFWYFISCFPTALFTYFLFNVPASFSENTKYVYIFIIYTLIGAVFYTMNNIAYSTLTALCTNNKEDRVQMGSYRYFFARVAAVLINSFTIYIVNYFGGGQGGWHMVSLIYSILCVVLLLVPVFSVKELPEKMLEVNSANNDEIGFLDSIKLLLKNKYFILMFLLYTVTYVSEGVSGGMAVYFAKYNLNNDAALGPISMANYIPLIIALPFVSLLTKKMTMQKASILGHILGTVGGILIIIGGFSGSFSFILFGIGLKAVGLAPQTGMQNAIIAEADDYSGLKFGKKTTGTIYSSASVGLKLGSGLGIALTGFLLDFSGFNGAVFRQSSLALSTINWSFTLSHALLPMISLIIFLFMDVEKVNSILRKKVK